MVRRIRFHTKENFMRIKRIVLKNFGLFEDLVLPFAASPDSEGSATVLIGNNGAGKTTILQAIAIALSWIPARIARERGSGKKLDDLQIHNGKNGLFLKIDTTFRNEAVCWQLSKAEKGRIFRNGSDLSGVQKVSSILREELSEKGNTSLPLIAYYPVERTIIDIPLRIRNQHSFGQLDGYDGALESGVDFRRFFEWFRNQEDIEHQQNYERLKEHHSHIAETKIENAPFRVTEYDSNGHEISFRFRKDPQIQSVRTAIEAFMPGVSNLRVDRKPLRMLVDKGGETLNVHQLSQGEKSLLALVGDIARRLAIMNPGLEHPTDGRGIVLIDEVDLHLHPRWQKDLICNLRATFPNCQFILTTHSPIVISDTPDVQVLSLDNGEVHEVGNLFGMDANQVLVQEMDVEARNQGIQNRLDDILDFIQDNELEKARDRLSSLEQELPEDHWELAKLRVLLARREVRRAQN